MNRLTRNALLASAMLAAPALAQSLPSASVSFVTDDEVLPGDTITIEVVCDYDTASTASGLFGSPGLYLFACNTARISGPASSTGSIVINPAFPALQAPGVFNSADNARVIAGCTGSAPAAAENPVTLFTFQQEIAGDASDGDEITFTYEGAVIFDAGGELFSIGSTGANAYELVSSTTVLTVGPGAPTSCNAADITEPFEVLDLADINLFITSFLSQSEFADLDGNGIYDLTDISQFVNAFTAGCP